MTHELEGPTEIILNSIADGVFTVDTDFKVTSFNRAAEEITGIPKSKAIGRYCWEVFRASICERLCALNQTMGSGQSIVNKSIYIINATGQRIPVSISTALLRDERGQIIGGVETFRDLTIVEELRKELHGRISYLDIISKNSVMQRLFEMVDLVSETDATVLIEGESGTGKELFATAIHMKSERNKGPLVTINCGALPDTLLESELFGYKAGAFTDAKKDKPGRLALATGGTLFLDEIGDISPMLQIRLLRVLQDKTYEPLGGVKPEKADVRVVAATNKNLEELVADGSFRKDLFYRINVVKLSLPPLRRRKEDIPLLVEQFVHKFSTLNAKDIEGVSATVMSTLMAYDFPGNIRELENIIEHATIVCRGPRIRMEHLPDHMGRPSVHMETGSLLGDFSLDTVERQLIHEALKRNHWNRKATALEMGIHPSTLWRKIKRLNISMPVLDGRSRNRPA
ncbi:MAG: sigma 54-interacting transcriptional regulator [Pseudomonadota bacterium]